MSLWTWLTGRGRSVERPDLIWLTSHFRLDGLRINIVKHLAEFQLIVVTSHFSDRLEELRDLLDANEMPYREATRAIRAREIDREFESQQDRTVIIAPALALIHDELPAASVDTSYRVAVFAAERHPLRQFDERIERFAKSIPYSAELQFFVSLDDVVLKLFSGDWVRDTLRRLGMKEDESINSAMVAGRLKRAQRKVEQRYRQLHGMTKEAAIERLQQERLTPWKNADEWMITHGMEDRDKF